MTSQPIASDLSYEVLQLRRRQFQLTLPELDNRLRTLYPITVAVERQAFIADREAIRDSFQGGLSYDRTFVGYQR